MSVGPRKCPEATASMRRLRQNRNGDLARLLRGK